MTPSAQRLLDACALVEALRPIVDRNLTTSASGPTFESEALQRAWDKARGEVEEAAKVYAP